MFVLMVVLVGDLLKQFLKPTFIAHAFMDFCEDHKCSLTLRVDAAYDVKSFNQHQIASHINNAQNDRFLHRNIFPNQVAFFPRLIHLVIVCLPNGLFQTDPRMSSFGHPNFLFGFWPLYPN